MLARYERGTDASALAMLAVTSGLFTALFEAAWLLGRRSYEVVGTLGNNFNPAMFEVGVPAAWQVLVFGLFFALGAAGRETLRVRAASRLARAVSASAAP